MRTTSITIGRKTYPLCYSTAVDLAIEAELGGLAALGEAIDSDADHSEKAETLAWTVEKMLEAGARYVELSGGEPRRDWPAQPELLDLLSMADMMAAVIGCIKAGAEREVDAEPPKNATATGGALPRPPRGSDGTRCARGFLTRMRSIFRTASCWI